MFRSSQCCLRTLDHTTTVEVQGGIEVRLVRPPQNLRQQTSEPLASFWGYPNTFVSIQGRRQDGALVQPDFDTQLANPELLQLASSDVLPPPSPSPGLSYQGPLGPTRPVTAFPAARLEHTKAVLVVDSSL